MEKFLFDCPACKKRLSVKRNETGLKAKCPACENFIIIPQSVSDFSKPSTAQNKRQAPLAPKRLSQRVYLIGSLAISLLWAILAALFLPNDDTLYLLQSNLSYSKYSAIVIGFAGSFFIITLTISFFIWGLAKLIGRSKSKLDFVKALFYTALTLGILTILGSLGEESLSNIESKIVAKPNSHTFDHELSTKKLGRSDYYQSTLDNFVCYFPEQPNIQKAKSSGLTYRSYQASEIYQSGFVFYSVTFSTHDNKTPFAFSSEDSRQFLISTVDQFRLTLSTTVPKNFSKRFDTFLDCPAIEYKFDFEQDGVECTNRGILFLDKHRIIRISISFSRNVSDDLIAKKYYDFKNTFGFISK